MSYPANLAGTLDPYGIVISGDDAPKWSAAGYPTESVRILCSARIADGSQIAPNRPVRIAVDCNGAKHRDIAETVGAHAFECATGIYDGQTLDSVICYVNGADIVSIHYTLRETLTGFGCFAVFA